jgi:hypothetical protein
MSDALDYINFPLAACVMRALEDVLGAELPEGKGWLRMPECPFCGKGGRRSPTVVNHDAGWFVCHSCGERRSASYDDSAAARFAEVRWQAAWVAWRKFPGAFTLDKARSFANERLCVYAGPDNGSCADAGALERWEKEAEGADIPEAMVDRYVMHALGRDLFDEGRRLLNLKRREVPEGIGTSVIPGEDPEKVDYLTKLLEAKAFKDWEYMSDSGHFPPGPLPGAVRGVACEVRQQA